MDTSYLWILFNVFVLLMLILDLGVFHKKAHEVKIKEAVIWSIVWISLALIFNAGVYHYMGEQKAVEFLTAYLIEKALSVDNIFVFILIFSFFKVPAEYQHKVLFWGVLGALVMRIILIIAGVALIENFHWVIYVFGLFLVYTGIKMITHKDKKFDPEKNPVVKAARKRFNISGEFHGSRFFFRQNGALWATPLFLVLLLIEVSDLIFAVDSIPAVLAVSTDTFIVYTSNVFAILGLRSLYFALAGMVDKFKYLSYGLAAVLVFVGIKMMISGVFKFPTLYSLLIIISILIISVLLSILKPEKRPELADEVKPEK